MKESDLVETPRDAMEKQAFDRRYRAGPSSLG
jgi:hypothetical protein